MKELLTTVAGSIRAAILDIEKNGVCLIFDEMVSIEVIKFAVRNLWVNIIPENGGSAKISKSMMQLETKIHDNRLCIYFSTTIPLEGNKIGGRVKIIESSVIIGDQLLLLNGRSCLRQLKITEDFEKKLKEAN
jgi:hypothetical protein